MRYCGVSHLSGNFPSIDASITMINSPSYRDDESSSRFARRGGYGSRVAGYDGTEFLATNEAFVSARRVTSWNRGRNVTRVRGDEKRARYAR